MAQTATEAESRSPVLRLVDESEDLRRSGKMGAAIEKAIEAEMMVQDKVSNATKYQVYRQLVSLHLRKNSLSRAQSYLQEARAISTDLDSLPLIAEVNYFSGFLYNKLGNLDESLRYYDQAVGQMAEVGDSTRMVKIYINMGRIYAEKKDYHTSVDITQRAVELAEVMEDSIHLSLSLQNLGANYKFMERPDSALQALNRALSLNTSSRTRFKNVYPLVNMAEIYKDKGEVDAFRSHVFEAHQIAEGSGRLDVLAVANRNLAEYYLFIEDEDSALIMAEESWYHAQLEQDPRVFGAIMEVLVDANKALGRWETATCWVERYKAHELEMLDVEKNEFGEELRVRFEVEKMDAENAILKEGQAELKRQQSLTYLVSGLLGLLMIGVVVILARANRRSKKFSDALSAKNAEIEASNAQLMTLNADKDALMSIVAHDLKAPLSKIAGLLSVMDIVRDNPKEFESTKKLMESVVSSGENLINELVLLSSLEKSKVVSDMEPVDIHQILKECQEGFAATAGKKKIQLHLEMGAAGPDLVTSHKYLLRVLDNLVSNAIKFSPREKNVYLKGYFEDNTWKIEVRDEGPGIAAKDQDRLFQKFVRLQNRPTAGESSTGLGLSIVKELVEQLGGTISVSSEVGKGATFHLNLPVR